MNCYQPRYLLATIIVVGFFASTTADCMLKKALNEKKRQEILSPKLDMMDHADYLTILKQIKSVNQKQNKSRLFPKTCITTVITTVSVLAEKQVTIIEQYDVQDRLLTQEVYPHS